MTTYTAPLLLPHEYVQPGWLVEVHRDQTGPLYAAVVNVTECEDPDHPGTCGTVIEYPATEVHYSALAELTVRIPCEPDPATTPAGPAPGDTVWISTGRRGIPMHHVTQACVPTTRCGRPTHSGRYLVAAAVVERYAATTCPRCWPGATS